MSVRVCRAGAIVTGLALALSCHGATAVDDLPPTLRGCSDEGDVRQTRRRPGRPFIVYRLPRCKGDGLVPWTSPMELGPAVPDRWRIVESLGYERRWWDPYNGNNRYKADVPMFGEDWFYNLSIISDSVMEPRRFPVPVGVATTARPGALDTIGEGESFLFNQNVIVENVLYKGDTIFRPPDWEFRLIAVFNFNQTHFDEKGILDIDPDDEANNGRRRSDAFVGVQSLFVDKHLRNVSDRYDFDSLRVGIQPFSSDFRGFLFQDQQLGVRLFGTRANNLYQYNLAWFRRLEKDTNSGLNDLTDELRRDDVFFANLYRQDFPRRGMVSQATLAYNRNREKGVVKFDDNGFIARPASIFEERGRNYDVVYLGYSADGRVGRINLTASLYGAIGEQTSTRSLRVEDKIRSFFGAVEISFDRDWIRPRLSLLYARGDDDPFDDTAKGFDAIFENPQFAGADTSFFIRQAVPLIGGGGVTLSGRNGVLASLRSSKELGQSNFINPGVRLLGAGADLDLTPSLRFSVNLNSIWFDRTEVLEQLRQQDRIDRHFGLDVSGAFIWRPLFTQNIVVRFSVAALVPGSGFDALYGEDEEFPYSVLANVILTF